MTWTWVATLVTAEAGVIVIAVVAFVLIRWTTIIFDRKDLAARVLALESTCSIMEDRYARLSRGRKPIIIQKPTEEDPIETEVAAHPAKSREQIRSEIFQRLRNGS